MATNISVDKILAWNDFDGKSADKALPAIYEHAVTMSKASRDWYWKSIAKKKESAMSALVATLILLIIGTILPVVAGVRETEHDRLVCTQWGVIALAVAGLLQVCDRTFGWSSGWMRYIAAVTTMETLARNFELDWVGHIVEKGKTLGDADIKPLFDIAKQFEIEIGKVQTDETAKWASEFGSGLTALNQLIKSQREAVEKDVAAARADRDEKAKQTRTGSLEVQILHRGEAVAVEIAIDDNDPVEYLGSPWAATNIAPGPHKVSVKPKAPGAPVQQKIATVPAGDKGTLEFTL